MTEFRMPSLGADMTEGTLVEWLVKPGDPVHRGDGVAVVDTAKAAIEVECFTSGIVAELVAKPGDRLPVGAVLAIITAAADETAPAPPSTTRREPSPGPPVPTTPAPRSEPVPAPAFVPASAVLASPVVRHFAAEKHIDLHEVAGTGVGGRITHEDVLRATGCQPDRATPAQRQVAPARRRVTPFARRLAAELGVDLATVIPAVPGDAIDADDVRRTATPAATPAAISTAISTATPAATPAATTAGRDLGAIRSAIAALMARSKREIPHYYLTTTIDLGTASAWLRRRNRELPVPRRLVPGALLLKAAARAARAVPELNGFWRDDAFVPAPVVHLGVAVSLRGGGLVTPAIHDAADLPVPELMGRLRDLVARARAGRLRGSELTDATITVSSLGDVGVESIIGVIYPPQVALVGFGAVVERPWAVDGLIGVRPVVVTSLAGDHRATDGQTGARFLNTLDRLLQDPANL